MGNITDFLNLAAMLDKAYKARLDCIKDVKVSRCDDVLTPHQIAYIRDVIKPEANMCYRNALLVAMYLKCEYVEGYVDVGAPIEHAFNKIGDVYIDVTLDILHGDDVTEKEYASFGEYRYKEAEAIMAKNGVYGNVFNTKLLKKCKKRNRGEATAKAVADRE